MSLATQWDPVQSVRERKWEPHQCTEESIEKYGDRSIIVNITWGSHQDWIIYAYKHKFSFSILFMSWLKRVEIEHLVWWFYLNVHNYPLFGAYRGIFQLDPFCRREPFYLWVNHVGYYSIFSGYFLGPGAVEQMRKQPIDPAEPDSPMIYNTGHIRSQLLPLSH